jgi:hypothetical protein
MLLTLKHRPFLLIDIFSHHSLPLILLYLKDNEEIYLLYLIYINIFQNFHKLNLYQYFLVAYPYCNI